MTIGCALRDLTGLTLMTAIPSSSLQEPLLTAGQVGALLGGIPTNTVLQYARDGRLPCVRLGKHVRFMRSDVATALEALREGRPPGVSGARRSDRRPVPLRC